jgi:hypothetical protein
MAAIIDIEKFSFHGEEVKAISEMVFDEVVKAPELSFIHTIHPNIVVDKEIGFIGAGGLVGKASNGCNPIPHSFSIPTRLVKWEPKDWEILIHACWSELKNTAAAYSLKSGTLIADFTSTDYMQIVITVLTEAMKKFVLRVLWFGDEDAENYVPAHDLEPASGGEITEGVDVGYFTLLNGFWKQIALQYTAQSSQRVTIAENAGATEAAQKMVPANVQGYLSKLKYGAPVTLRSQSGLMYICTQSVYDAYEQSLSGIALESMYRNLVDGQKTLAYSGIPLVPIPIWDELIAAYFKVGDKLVNPNRVLLTTKEVLGVGVDDESSFGNIDIWYDKDTRKVKMEGMGILDAKLTNPAMLMVGI